jgi:hypothetical protein
MVAKGSGIGLAQVWIIPEQLPRKRSPKCVSYRRTSAEMAPGDLSTTRRLGLTTQRGGNALVSKPELALASGGGRVAFDQPE